jgi:hypothetical protein
MTRCNRFETEGLLALERGDELDPHFESCPDCRREREVYAQLCERIRDYASAEQPPADAEAKILELVARERETTASAKVPTRAWWIGIAVAAVLLALWLLPGIRGDRGSTGRGPGISSDPRLTVSIAAAAQTNKPMRGDTAKPGDRAIVEATTGGFEHVELRVYSGAGELLVRCTDAPPCRRTSDRVEAEIPLMTRGNYDIMLITSAATIANPGLALDQDIAAIEVAGGRIDRAARIEVR